MFRRLFMLAAVAGLAVAAVAAHAANPRVDLDTSAGKIRIELYPDTAPKTVENFLAYVQAKQYDGTQFLRVIPGFMIPGGGYTADFKETPTNGPIRNESEQSS
jgi:cyclophilin family peptidyl-prolyl cis-trans isomerase